MLIFENKLDNILGQELNPDIWDKENLNPEVRERILDVVNDFITNLETELPVIDLLLVGSMANYNWHDRSDIDTHIVVDYEQIDCSAEITDEYVSSVTFNWNDKHEVEIYGHEIELYIQDKTEIVRSSGQYSIIKKKWIDKPRPSDEQPNMVEVKRKAQRLIQRAKSLLSSDEIEPIDRFLEKMKEIRQSALDKYGEQAVDNLAFKEFRNSGLREQLKERKVELYDREMSLG